MPGAGVKLKVVGMSEGCWIPEAGGVNIVDQASCVLFGGGRVQAELWEQERHYWKPLITVWVSKVQRDVGQALASGSRFDGASWSAWRSWVEGPISVPYDSDGGNEILWSESQTWPALLGQPRTAVGKDGDGYKRYSESPWSVDS